MGEQDFMLKNQIKDKISNSVSSDEEEEESSYSLYSDFDNEKSFNEWESYVNEDKQLFYVEFQSNIIRSERISLNALSAAKGESNRASTRRSNKVSKLYKLVGGRHKEINNQSLNPEDDLRQSFSNSSKVTFNETFNGEVKEIKLEINPENRNRFGRRSTLSESILGLSLTAFTDKNRLMVENILPNFNSKDRIPIKIGDWLISINGIHVNSSNLDVVLQSFNELCVAKLQFQHFTEVDNSIMEPTCNFLNKILGFSMVYDTIELMNLGKMKNKSENELIFSLMYLSAEGFDENNTEGQDILYCYPPKNENFLYLSRGSFFTLKSILKNSFNANPKITSVIYENYLYFISYVILNEDLLLLGFRSDIITIEEVRYKTNEIIKYFEFIHQNLSETFYSENIYRTNLVCKLIELNYLIEPNKCTLFEKTLTSPILVPLPKEAQLRIDDALSEMEAMDYSEWNEEPFKSQREFFILGSVLYYKSFLLASHLAPNFMIDVEIFMRTSGIFSLIEKGDVKDLIVWLEIFPNYCKIHKLSRFFLAVVGVNSLCLAVILEFRSEEPFTVKIGPAPFYIEEFQDTLDHLHDGGIDSLAKTWIAHGRRPQINNESHGNVLSGSSAKKYEVMSILKRRNNSEDNVGTSSMYSQTISEDSEKKNDDDDDESDSDWDGFPDSHRSSGGFDMSDIAETLLKEVSDIIPTKLSAGTDNVLFHYIQIELGEAIILCPTNVQESNIISTFRKTCFLIHTVLQNTIKFRQLLTDEGNKANSNKSLVAIKEHGVLIKIKNINNEIIEFWVVGRLFNSPMKELYVCYRSDVPQNLVEIAFRLNLHICG